MKIDTNMILLFIPVILIQLTLMIICLVDWAKRKAFRYLPKIAWLLIILCTSYIGAICYLLLGRKDEYYNDQAAE